MGSENEHDVSVIGPGIWESSQLLAAHAQDEQGVRLFKNYMYFMAKHFPCMKCRTHIDKFLRTHPFENYTGDKINGKEVGYFRLIWYMHSVVNERLGKPFYPFETAYKKYFDTEECMEVCPGVIDEKDDVGKSKITLSASKNKKDNRRRNLVSVV